MGRYDLDTLSGTGFFTSQTEGAILRIGRKWLSLLVIPANHVDETGIHAGLAAITKV